MLRNKKRQETILVMYAEDFLQNHNSELLAHLEDVPNFKQGNTLNFKTNMRIGSQNRVEVIDAFNIYLQKLQHEGVDRIIINNINE